jgi:hypothetical protein
MEPVHSCIILLLVFLGVLLLWPMECDCSSANMREGLSKGKQRFRNIDFILGISSDEDTSDDTDAGQPARFNGNGQIVTSADDQVNDPNIYNYMYGNL